MRAVFVTLVLLLASPALADVFFVDVTTDGNDETPGDAICDDGNDQCPLRAAIQEANALIGPDEILLPTGVYALTLKRDKDVPDNQAGDLDVTSPITLTGLGNDTPCNGDGCTVIDGKKAKDRVFDVHAGAELVVEDLVIRNGKAAKDDFNDAQAGEVSGGCIRVDGAGSALSLEEVVVERCKSPDDGGCIGFTDGSAGSLADTFLDRCKTKDAGGGIEADEVTSLALNRVTIANSKAAEGGGVEATGGTLTLRNVTLSKNKGKVGGGIAVESDAAVTVNNTTFFDNKGKDSACIFADEVSQTTEVSISNSLLQSGGKALNCLGLVTSAGGNVENGDTCNLGAGDLPNGNTAIDKSLADNGGEVPTHAIEAESDARNQGDDLSCELADARGAARNGDCDSGAFEFGGVLP